MTQYQPKQPAASAGNPFYVSVDWARVFAGRPFQTPRFDGIEDAAQREKAERDWLARHATPLPMPVIAIKACKTQPPAFEVTDPGTGEVRESRALYPHGPWELLTNLDVQPPRREWWPVEARRRARMKEYRRFESSHADGE